MDSQGDTVYKARGDKDADQPIVAGQLVPPEVLKTPRPKIPKELRKQQLDTDVVVEGVITPRGNFIDLRVINAIDTPVANAILKTVAGYKFKPATLSGAPVAVLLQVTVNLKVLAPG